MTEMENELADHDLSEIELNLSRNRSNRVSSVKRMSSNQTIAEDVTDDTTNAIQQQQPAISSTTLLTLPKAHLTNVSSGFSNATRPSSLRRTSTSTTTETPLKTIDTSLSFNSPPRHTSPTASIKIDQKLWICNVVMPPNATDSPSCSFRCQHREKTDGLECPEMASASVSRQPTQRGQQNQYQHQQSQVKSLANRITLLKKENKTTQTLSIVVGGFIACWLPFFIYYLITPFLAKEQVSPTLAKTLTWLGWFNSAINPFIYAFYSVDFRAAFWRLTFQRCCLMNGSARFPQHQQQFYTNTASIRR